MTWGDITPIYTEPRSKIFGWNFDGLQITVQRCQCESLLAAGDAEKAAEVLLCILESIREETHTNEEIEQWVIGECRHLIVWT